MGIDCTHDFQSSSQASLPYGLSYLFWVDDKAGLCRRMLRERDQLFCFCCRFFFFFLGGETTLLIHKVYLINAISFLNFKNKILLVSLFLSAISGVDYMANGMISLNFCF